MNDLTVFKTFEEYRQTLTAELTKASESFVRIGYLLKVARDTAILSGTDYKDVNEFAAAEYNLDKTQVSRFIRINDRFSEGGNSDRLLESFRGIGYAKLSMMLLLPDSLNEEITPAFSKTEVQALKEEVQAEAEVTPLERMMEAPNPAAEDMSFVEKAFFELFKANQKIYAAVWKTMQEDICLGIPGSDEAAFKYLQEILAPAGEAIYSVRIAGMGRIAVSVKDTEREIQMVNLRTNEKTPCSWYEMLDAVKRFTTTGAHPAPVSYASAEKAYEWIFGEPWQAEEKKPEVAPVQPKKESKVIKAVPDKKPEPVKPKIEPVKPEPEPEEPKEEVPGPEEPAPAVIPLDPDSVQVVAENEGSITAEVRPVQAAPVEIPEDPEGCEGQADFNDIPEILPAPVYELSENARNWIGMWIHNLRADLTTLADAERTSAESLIKAALPVIRAELDKLEA